jgi:hypothetical protein
VAGLAQTKHRGLARVGWMFTLKALAYNLVRLPTLLPNGMSLCALCLTADSEALGLRQKR